MKVLLANPETSRSFYDFAGIIDDEPYELECLQAHLAGKGIESQIWDGQFDKDFRKAFLDYNPDAVYFCGRTRQENFIKEYCKFCKECSGADSDDSEEEGQQAGKAGKKGFIRQFVRKLKDPKYTEIKMPGDSEKQSFADNSLNMGNGGNTSVNGRVTARRQVITIVGGIHAQNCPERFREDYIDYIVSTFDPEAVSGIIEGKDPEEIAGLSWKVSDKIAVAKLGSETNGTSCSQIGANDGTRGQTDSNNGTCWRSNAKVPYDIRNMPWADRSNFYKYGAKYCYLELRPIAVIRTAYSCPYSCAFCYRNRLNCHRYTARDIEDVVNEIESIDCENIYIVDDDFLVNIHRLERFIELIKQRNIRKKYVCFGRADFIAKYPHVIKKLAQIGFYYILTGLEYIENRRLNDTDKRNDVNTNVRALRTCREFGIKMMGMFITDLDFTAHDFSNLYKWIRHFDLRHVAISIYTPEMCLENFADYVDRLITTDPAEWDYLHVVAKPEKMSVRKYYFHYHILLIKLFLRAQRQGVYDFMDYKAFIRSFLKNLFSFGG